MPKTPLSSIADDDAEGTRWHRGSDINIRRSNGYERGTRNGEIPGRDWEHFRDEEHDAVEIDTASVFRSCRRRRTGGGRLHRRCRSRCPDRAGRSFLRRSTELRLRLRHPMKRFR